MPDSNQPPPTAADLLADRENLRAVLWTLPVGVFIVDAQGQLLESNPSAEAIWGGVPPRVGVRDYGVYEGYWPGVGRRLEAHEWALARTLRDGQPVVNEEVDIVAFDGERRTVLVSTATLRDEQRALVGAVAVFVDITTHRQAERAEAFLTEATRLLVESLDWESTLQAVARLATRELADACVIDVLGDDGELYRMAAASRDPKHESLMRRIIRFAPKVGGRSVASQVFAEGRSLLIPNVTDEVLAQAHNVEHWRLLKALAPRSSMLVPLSAGKRRLGVIDFILCTPGQRFTERELRYAEELARRVALVVEHARLFRETQGALKARDTSLALLEAFLAASPVGMAYLDRELRYVQINPVLADINGRPPEAHLGRKVHEVLPESSEAARLERLLRDVVEHGRPLLDVEGMVPPRPGSPSRPVRASFFPVRVGEELRGVGVIVQDTTAQKRAEEGLRFLAEASTRLSASLDLRTTLESTARLVVERVADYCVMDVLTEDGQRLERMAVVAREPDTQALLEKVQCFAPPPGSPSPARQVLEMGRARLMREVTAEDLDRLAQEPEHRALLEQLGPRSAMLAPLIARGRTLGVLTAVSQDPVRRYTEGDMAFLEDLAWRAALAVDNARLFQRAEQAVAARDEFVAIATHELRTPLSALHLQVVKLQRAVDAETPPSPEWLHQSLVTAQRQIERLDKLVNHLLNVSRISAGRLELEREEVDLSALVRWLVTRFAGSLEEAGCTPVVRAEAPVVARVDRLRVEQVLMNLLSNAMKYAPGRPVEVGVEREEAMAVLWVRDQGPGISPEAQARIFERFQRATGEHARESLGLGLYVSRQLALAHGGDLTVESTPGQGARFILRLPLG
jgi:PAS domain S-box-containing protein